MVLGVPLFAVIYGLLGSTVEKLLSLRGRNDLIAEYREHFSGNPPEEHSASDDRTPPENRSDTGEQHDKGGK